MKPEIGYVAAHRRVVARHGPARDHVCVTCGAPAQHWAYRHDDPNELLTPAGAAYSVNPTYYDPMCVPCHGRADRARHPRPPRELVAAVRQLAKIRRITASEAWRRAAQEWLGVKPHPYTVHLEEKER